MTNEAENRSPFMMIRTYNAFWNAFWRLSAAPLPDSLRPSFKRWRFAQVSLQGKIQAISFYPIAFTFPTPTIGEI